MKRIFISYSQKDHYKISEVIEKLQKEIPEFKDAEVWDPISKLSVGTDFRKEIKKQILSSDLYVLLWTEDSATSPWVLYEAGIADAVGKQIIIITGPDSPDLFGSLSEYHAIRLEN